jgi:hypothetical protein
MGERERRLAEALFELLRLKQLRDKLHELSRRLYAWRDTQQRYLFDP